MVGYVDVRAYAELNDFLAPDSRGMTVRRPFRSHQTVKDVLEAMGIPHSTAAYPLLRQAVRLPAPKVVAPRARARRR